MPASTGYSMLRRAMFRLTQPVATMRPAAMNDAWNSGMNSMADATSIPIRIANASGARAKFGRAESCRRLTSRKSRLYLCRATKPWSASTSSVSPGSRITSPSLPARRAPSREIEMIAAPYRLRKFASRTVWPTTGALGLSTISTSQRLLCCRSSW